MKVEEERGGEEGIRRGRDEGGGGQKMRRHKERNRDRGRGGEKIRNNKNRKR